MAETAHQNGGHTNWHVRAPTPEPTLITAVSEVVEAGHRVIANRLALGLLEVRAILHASATTVAFMLVAAVLFATAWIVFNAGVALALTARFPPPLALLALAAANALLAGLFAIIAARARRNIQRAAGSGDFAHAS